jgi:sporulation protein YtfJ
MANTDNKLEEMIQTSLESLRPLVDSDTIIGKPIKTDVGTTIIPISKISMGYTTGGLEYYGKNSPQRQNFGGGGGTGLSITPVGFLVVNTEGNVNLINMGQSAAAPDAVEQIAAAIERAPEIFAKIKALFKKNDTEDKDAPAEEKAQG